MVHPCLWGVQVSDEEEAVKPCSCMWSEDPLSLVEGDRESLTACWPHPLLGLSVSEVSSYL